MNAPLICGFLNLYKTVGPTSFDCIRAIRRIFKREGFDSPKLGHLGTLDPLAEGVLPIALGPARKLIRFFKPEKVYEATICLGLKTKTDDVRGTVIQECDVTGLDETLITAALKSFEGEFKQVPPRFSAVRADGVKAYKQARVGKQFELKPKLIRVRAIEMLGWKPPKLELRLTVGPGTYIRGLARDLGGKLGVGGCVAALKRVSDGPFLAADAVSIDELERRGANEIEDSLLPPDFILGDFKQLALTEEEGASFSQGKKLNGKGLLTGDDTGFKRVYDPDGFIGVGVIQDDILKPHKVIRARSF